MRKLNIGCGSDLIPGWINLDQNASNGVTLCFDLDSIPRVALPLDENSIDEIFASHIIEHLRSPLEVFEELWRIAAPGCQMIIRVPHGASDSASNDPTHRRNIYPGFFNYLGQPKYHKFCYNYFADWKISQMCLTSRHAVEFKGRSAELSVKIETLRNYCDEIIVVLNAVKPPRPRSKTELSSFPIFISAPIGDGYMRAREFFKLRN
jgi:predicted SAM-dependent methyltransferase